MHRRHQYPADAHPAAQQAGGLLGRRRRRPASRVPAYPVAPRRARRRRGNRCLSLSDRHDAAFRPRPRIRSLRLAFFGRGSPRKRLAGAIVPARLPCGHARYHSALERRHSCRPHARDPLPYLFACALIANAASFVLPISNPANLVVFHDRMPPLPLWLVWFAFPSLLSILATYLVLRWVFRSRFAGPVHSAIEVPVLTPHGKLVVAGLFV